jgi:hypothetical protein
MRNVLGDGQTPSSESVNTYTITYLAKSQLTFASFHLFAPDSFIHGDRREENKETIG